MQEFSYERILCTLLASQGVEVVAEDRQSEGRAARGFPHAMRLNYLRIAGSELQE